MISSRLFLQVLHALLRPWPRRRLAGGGLGFYHYLISGLYDWKKDDLESNRLQVCDFEIMPVRI